MSVDEDTELRDLVVQALESNGVLGKIRAQLRSNVFLALEEQDTAKNKRPFVNPDLKKFIGTKEGKMVTSLVREFLQHFDLEYTLAVFDPEVGLGDDCESRANLAREYNIIESSDSESCRAPLLVEVVKRGAGAPPSARGRTSSTTEDLGLKHLQEARLKFDTYDEDKNGTIDKNELRSLFSDMFPNFHRNMLERYVNDEFKAVDKDFSNTIDFEEFLDMYKRLFVLCKSVVSHDVSDITLASPRRMSDTPSAPTSKIPAPLKKTDSIDEEDESKSEKKGKDSRSGSGSSASPRKSSGSTDGGNDDSFFDDPPPDSSNVKGFGAAAKKAEEKPPGSSAMTSLAGLPPLAGGGGVGDATTPRMPDVTKEDFADIDKRLSGLDLGGPTDEDYDEDFESSNVSGGLGVTPRSARTDVGAPEVEDEEIEEDIPEELSAVDDFLKSDNSGVDDLTTDRTVSPTEQGNAFDYVEEVLS